eukprot:CAMPEP_0177622356 /NCGR_PEP_ID=MMETSP0419_2-20121207/28196_1 /TAXON_ID=582737 /ORGANISM="Tetraselmis sp., Strain GSL018" /LENGTH=192 /DNA_ID=CAMNT_0019122577 /DNA_START=59 /DNA_END=637 /DNA_ORIENTATION=+
MVRVVDGEIVQDDDPRLQSGRGNQDNVSTVQSQRNQNASLAPQRFNLSAPAFRILPTTSAGSFMGLPPVEVFGVQVEALHYCLLAATTAFLGIRGFLGGGCLLAIMYMNRQQGPAAATPEGTRVRLRPPGGGSGQQAGSGGGLGDAMRRYATQPPPGREYREPNLSGARAEGPAAGGQGGSFPGTGRKLGSS